MISEVTQINLSMWGALSIFGDTALIPWKENGHDLIFFKLIHISVFRRNVNTHVGLQIDVRLIFSIFIVTSTSFNKTDLHRRSLPPT